MVGSGLAHFSKKFEKKRACISSDPTPLVFHEPETKREKKNEQEEEEEEEDADTGIKMKAAAAVMLLGRNEEVWGRKKKYEKTEKIRAVFTEAADFPIVSALDLIWISGATHNSGERDLGSDVCG